jgi:hypothetical protein
MEYEARTDARLTLNTSVGTPENLLAEALNACAAISALPPHLAAPLTLISPL